MGIFLLYLMNRSAGCKHACIICRTFRREVAEAKRLLVGDLVKGGLAVIDLAQVEI